MSDPRIPPGRTAHQHLTENLEADWSHGPLGDDQVDLAACLPAHEVLRRDRRVQRQFWFVFLFTVFVCIVLGVRAEVAQRELGQQEQQIRVATYSACVKRSELAVTYNQGRDALITFILMRQRDQSAEALAFTNQQLRDGLFLPVEICGPAPTL